LFSGWTKTDGSWRLLARAERLADTEHALRVAGEREGLAEASLVLALGDKPPTPPTRLQLPPRPPRRLDPPRRRRL
jgi:hypothetical protein